MLWTGKDEENNWIGAVDGSLGPLHLHSSPQFLRSHLHSTVQQCRTPILATVYFTLQYSCLHSEPSSCSSLYQKLDFSVSFVKPCPWVSCCLCKHKHNDGLKVWRKCKISGLVSELVSYSGGGLVKPEEVFCNGEYPADTLFTEPVNEVLLLGIPVDGEGKELFEPLTEPFWFRTIFDVLILIWIKKYYLYTMFECLSTLQH